MNHELYALAEQLGHILQTRGMKIVTAESCTGGWIAQTITDVPGSSAWFDRGFVTYSNNAKIQMLGVKKKTIDQYGAVSEETAKEMVSGALKNSEANIGVAVTGIAGPKGGSAEKPVGLVFVAWQIKFQGCKVIKKNFQGNRSEVRRQTVSLSLSGINDLCFS